MAKSPRFGIYSYVKVPDWGFLGKSEKLVFAKLRTTLLVHSILEAIHGRTKKKIARAEMARDCRTRLFNGKKCEHENRSKLERVQPIKGQ
jgi:hypothetical protein